MEAEGIGNHGNNIIKIQHYTKSDIIKMRFTVYVLKYFFPPSGVSLINKEFTKSQANHYYLKVTQFCNYQIKQKHISSSNITVS
jgi:hypothetical protein